MKSVATLFLLFFCVTAVSAQHAHTQDSIRELGALALMRQMDSLRNVDSLKHAALLAEIESLKGSQTGKQREALLDELRELKQKDSVRSARLAAQLAALDRAGMGYPVAPFGDTLFLIFSKVGSYSPEERAASVTEKIQRVYGNELFNPDSIKLASGETSTDILFQDMAIMSVNDVEALWRNTTHHQLAARYREIISDAIRKERDENSLVSILIRIGEVLLIILAMYILIRLINKGFYRLRRKAISARESVLKGVRFRGYQLLDSKRELKTVIFTLRVLRGLLIFLMLYLTLPLLFSVFPWTRGIAETMLGWILTPLANVATGLIEYLPNLFTIIVIVVLTHYAIKLLKFIASEIENGDLAIPGFYPEWAKPTLTLIKILLYAFSFIIIFPYLPGSDSPIFQGVSVFLGILFSLGSSSAISNAVAGFVITYMRPFKVGDRIRIGEITGDVIEKSFLVTRLRTIKNEDITIPNASVLSGHTINYSTSASHLGLILHASLTVGYDVPWKKVHDLLIEAAMATGGTLNDEHHRPFVLQTGLDDFYASYQINVYTNEPHQMAAIYSALYQQIQNKFQEAGIELTSFHYHALRDGSATTIPGSSNKS